MDLSDIHYQPLTEVAALIKTKELSPVEVTEAMLKRIGAVDGKLHSYISVTAEDARMQARKAEAEIASGRYRGPLHGVPIAIKDLLYTAGSLATFGSGAYKDFRSNYNATIVERMEQAGAVFLGRLALHEGAFGDHHEIFGPAPQHPYKEGYWPGGSSSGSGAATAAGLAYATIGSDTGGSIRFPSGTNGVTGLKPSWGRVSRYGVFGLSASLDHVGPMARSAADAAAMLGVIAGDDPMDATTFSEPVPDYLGALSDVFGARGLRIGVDWKHIEPGTNPEIVECMRQALDTLAAIGAEIVPVTVPSVDECIKAQLLIMITECASFHRDVFNADSSGFGPILKKSIEDGMKTDPIELARAYIERDRFGREFERMFGKLDLIAVPVMPELAISYDDLPKLYENMGQMVRFTSPYNMSGSPTVTFPVGMSSLAMPISMQLIGPLLSEDVLLRAAHAFQQATDWHLKRPPLD
jgi:amidase